MSELPLKDGVTLFTHHHDEILESLALELKGRRQESIEWLVGQLTVGAGECYLALIKPVLAVQHERQLDAWELNLRMNERIQGW